MRKIAVVGGLAVGAGLAFAPLASADPVTSTLDSEISSLNSSFDFEALLAGKGSDVIAASTANPYDTIPLADAPNTAPFTTLDYELWGSPATDGPTTDPGSYDLFNGATGKFDDAYNIALYALDDKGALDPNAADFIGSTSSIDHALGLANAADAFEYFYNFGIGDLSGFFNTDLSALDITPAMATELFTFLGSL
jgi:hypothetical protein